MLYGKNTHRNGNGQFGEVARRTAGSGVLLGRPVRADRSTETRREKRIGSISVC
jgi:hypothetical protein